MELIPVTSSQIAAIGHDPQAEKLRIKFNTGSIYEYDHVPTELHDRLMSAESIGSFFGQWIKRNPETYPYQRIS